MSQPRIAVTDADGGRWAPDLLEVFPPMDSGWEFSAHWDMWERRLSAGEVEVRLVAIQDKPGQWYSKFSVKIDACPIGTVSGRGFPMTEEQAKADAWSRAARVLRHFAALPVTSETPNA